MTRKISSFTFFSFLVYALCIAPGCSTKEDFTSLSQLGGKVFAVPTGTVADKLVLSKFPQAKFQYFNSVLDAVMASGPERPMPRPMTSRS